MRTIAHAYPDRTPTVTLSAAPDLRAPCERQEFDEIAGNLLDNAAKWAAGRVAVTAANADGWFTLTVADDGPGLAPAARAAAFDRGRRLDERPQGAGLGLAIVRDLVTLYGGEVALKESPLGGLAAVVRLPAAVAA